MYSHNLMVAGFSAMIWVSLVVILCHYQQTSCMKLNSMKLGSMFKSLCNCPLSFKMRALIRPVYLSSFSDMDSHISGWRLTPILCMDLKQGQIHPESSQCTSIYFQPFPQNCSTHIHVAFHHNTRSTPTELL